METHNSGQSSSAYLKAAETLTSSLKLRHAPVAISFTDSIPSGLPEHGGQAPAGCRFWEDAQTSGFFTRASDHDLCAIGIYTHNLHPTASNKVDLQDALQAFNMLGYVRNEEVGSIPVLRQQPEYIVYSLLANAPAVPDVVILFVNACQSLILAEATEQVEGRPASAMGRPACAVVPAVANSGRAALSLGCCGARAYLDLLTDNLSIFAIPGRRMDAYVARIEVLAAANEALARFHQIRREEIGAGHRPSVQDTLAQL